MTKGWRLAIWAVVLTTAGTPAAWTQVEFELAGDVLSASPESVHVAGSFNQWSTTATALTLEGGTWSGKVSLPDGRHYYKFVWCDVGGEANWLTDPQNPCMADDGHGGANSIVDVTGGRRSDARAGMECFEIRVPSRTEWVNVAGDFNGWRQGQFSLLRAAPTTWRAFVEVDRPVTFKFIVDGIWRAWRGESDVLIHDGHGGMNVFRKPADWPPAIAPEPPVAVAAGDAEVEKTLQALADAGEYGKAVALARKIAAVNGSHSPLTFRALAREADLHRRWGLEKPAIECWTQLLALAPDSEEAQRAAAELTAYYLYAEPDYDQAIALATQRMSRAKSPSDYARTAIDVAQGLRKAHQYVDALSIVDSTFQTLPAPDGTHNDYASLYCEIWLLKAYVFHESGQRENARAAFEKTIQYSPWPDSQPALMAKKALDGMERKDGER